MFCLWYSVAIFSKTEIIFATKYDSTEIVLPKLSEGFVLSLDNDDKDEEAD